MRRVRLQTCTAVFLILTVIKMISPVSAVQTKNELQPVLDRNDDYHFIIHRVERILYPINYSDCAPYVPHPPLTELRKTLDGLMEDPLSDLPKAVSFPESDAAPEPEIDPALEFGYNARETFLDAQAQITDALPPENVSYDVLSLPFEESAPILGESSSGFGYRMHPILNELRFHYGTDFAADAGTEIHAFADGTVLKAGIDEGYGTYVKLDHGSGFITLYGHCSELWVSEGETVSRGQPIALVGSTGQSTGPHLHFELIHDSVYLNPEFYLYT